jgi:predicted nucleic acid-binding protein
LAILVDSNVLLDLFTADPVWLDWSRATTTHYANTNRLIVNPVIYAEVSVSFATIEELDDRLPREVFRREGVPFAAAFLAGKAHAEYRRRGGSRQTPLGDFYIGAHAAIAGHRLLTRDATRYRSYFPTLELIAPN